MGQFNGSKKIWSKCWLSLLQLLITTNVKCIAKSNTWLWGVGSSPDKWMNKININVIYFTFECNRRIVYKNIAFAIIVLYTTSVIFLKSLPILVMKYSSYTKFWTLEETDISSWRNSTSKPFDRRSSAACLPRPSSLTTIINKDKQIWVLPCRHYCTKACSSKLFSNFKSYSLIRSCDDCDTFCHREYKLSNFL